MFRGNYYSQQEQGFPWQQEEQSERHGHHGHHGHHDHHGHDGPHFGGPRGQWGPGFGRRGGFGGFGGFGGYGRPEITPEQQVLFSTAVEVGRLFGIAARSTRGNPERQAQLRSFLERSRTELLALIGESKPSAQQEGQQPNVEQA